MKCRRASANLEFERAALLARSNHGSEERHRPVENRTETPAGEIHAQLRPPAFAGLNLSLGIRNGHLP